MNNRQIDRLLENAQKLFMDELKGKIDAIQELLKNCKDQCTREEAERLERFFHSVSGTASTLGFHHLSSIGREWEVKLKNILKRGDVPDRAVLRDAHEAVNILKKKAEQMGANIKAPGTLAECGDYVNMPDRGKILLVDDDVAILKLLENAFTLECYKVYICDDSETAMDTIALVRPDIVILDLMMPKLDGYEILEKIKSMPEYSDMHVIILSARSDIDDKVRGIKAGADDYITKPFVITEVITRVEMIMRRSENYREKLLKDSLTDAYSRYYFNLRIAEELERFKRNGTIFSIAFIDMDHFKHINDKYGHQVGDCVLRELVAYIIANTRKCDSVFRYGGEEFVILMPDTTDEQAFVVIERLRKGFGEKTISVGDVDLNVTFSAGIRQVNEKTGSIDQIISDADKAMYYSKKCGRNRVSIYDEKMDAEDLKKTLLIVDDESTILKLLRDRLSSTGYRVITAKDGTSALELVREVHPDAVILDIVLPGMDGFEVCKRIKEDAATQATKVIMLSRRKHRKSIIRGFQTGADDYVTKPFSMEELESRIMKVLNNAD